jgi:hypothetical protein
MQSIDSVHDHTSMVLKSQRSEISGALIERLDIIKLQMQSEKAKKGDS